MGNCCFAPHRKQDPFDSDESSPPQQQSQIPRDDLKNKAIAVKNWPFTEFYISDLQTATNDFSSDKIISENVEESQNVIYKGQLQNNLGFIAIKRFKLTDWPNPAYLASEAKELSELKHKRLVKLVGYCADEDERLLVSEFMPNDTLAKHLFYPKKGQLMEWSMRMRVAYHVAEALEYCKNENFTYYNNLSAYTILFDEDGDACVSCFGLIKHLNDYPRTTGRVDSDTVTFRFGIILLNLLTGIQFTPIHAPMMIKGKTYVELIDPALEGKYSKEEANMLYKIACECFVYTDRDSLITKDLVSTLKILQTQAKTPSLKLKKKHDDEASSSSQQQSKAKLKEIAYSILDH